MLKFTYSTGNTALLYFLSAIKRYLSILRTWTTSYDVKQATVARNKARAVTVNGPGHLTCFTHRTPRITTQTS